MSRSSRWLPKHTVDWVAVIDNLTLLLGMSSTAPRTSQSYLQLSPLESAEHGATDARPIAPQDRLLACLLQAQDVRIHRQSAPGSVRVVGTLHPHHIVECVGHIYRDWRSGQDAAHLESGEDKCEELDGAACARRAYNYPTRTRRLSPHQRE
jgi:hypothetical protein